MSADYFIDEVVSSSNVYSKSIDGGTLLPFAERGQDATAILQLIPQSGADFEVTVEAAVNVPAGATFGTIGRYNQADEARVAIIHVSKHALYRFKHESGADVRVIMR